MKTFVLFICILMLCGCKETNPISYGEVKTIKDYKVTKHLSATFLEYVSNKGMYGCEVKYPYLFTNLSNQKSFVAIYDLESKRYIGDFFNRGQANNEYIDFNILNQFNDSLFYVIDPQKRRIKAFRNIITDSCNMYTANEINYKINDDIFSIFVIDNEIAVYKAYNEQDGFFFKRIKDNKIIYPYKYFGKNDINNILSMADGMNNNASKIVSITGSFDQIDIFSFDDENNMSIMFSDNFKSLDDIRNNNEQHEYFIGLPRCKDDNILLLHNGEHSMEFILIDWNGNGLAKYIIKEKLIDFSVDWDQETIYGVTDDEKVVSYQNFLKEL